MTQLFVGTTTEFQRNRAICVDHGELAILVFRLDDGYFALENRCTHRDVRLETGTVENDEVICPLHAARFEIRTGRFLNAPATSDLKTYPVILVGDDVFVEVEIKQPSGG